MTAKAARRSQDDGEKARAAEPAPHLAVPRPPQQERGLRRVNAILDATAALITEEGVAGVTMHRVARHSRTTIGSMYHFFPDREALLAALVERHACHLRRHVAESERDAEEWAQLVTEAVVDRFLEPYLTYGAQHPDLLLLTQYARTTVWGAERYVELGRLLARRAEVMVASRRPQASGAEVAVRAMMVVAMMQGIWRITPPSQPSSPGAPSAAALQAELRRALVAYLDSQPRP